MDYRYRASSNFSPNIVSETGSTGFVEDLVRLQAEAASDDFFLDLGCAAEDRLDAAKPTELTIAAQSSGLVLPPVKAGSIGSARAAAFARRDLGGDHPPWIVWPRRNSPVRGVAPMTAPDQRPRISQPPVQTSTPELIAVQLPQVLVVHDASGGSQIGSCSREPPRGNQYLGRVQDAHHTSMGTCGAR
jgi:hypothetical protein